MDSPKTTRIPKTDGLKYGESFLYCPNDNSIFECGFQLPPGVACNPFCPICKTRLHIWRVEEKDPKPTDTKEEQK